MEADIKRTIYLVRVNLELRLINRALVRHYPATENTKKKIYQSLHYIPSSCGARLTLIEEQNGISCLSQCKYSLISLNLLYLNHCWKKFKVTVTYTWVTPSECFLKRT